MSLNGRRIVILAAQEYEDLELWYPKLRLQEAGANVIVAGLGWASYSSKHGYPVEPDAVIDDLDPSEYDGVIVPGGWAPDALRRSEAVKSFVVSIERAGGLVAAICHGGWVLASAGVASGRRVTSSPAIRDDLSNAGAEWVDAPVVVDRNIVTSRRPADLPAFMPAVIAILAEKDKPAGAVSDARLLVDGDLISISMSPESLEYMLDMLNRMPAAKGYRESVPRADHDLTTIVRDFVTHSDPRGQLEVDAAQIVDVSPAGDGWRVQGNLRTLIVLEGADVPGIAKM